jgi:cell wall-associated NlpC family hydrolase
VPTVSEVAPTPTTTSSYDDVVRPDVPAEGFQAALRAVDVRALPSVGLATMVAHRAGAVAPPMAAAGAASVTGAATGAAPAVPSAATAPPASAAGTGRGAAAITAGERYLGVPYRWGGTNPSTGFDCSGFVQRAFADVGISLPRVSVDQAKAGQAVASLDQARPGDLVFWRGNGTRPNHIGIYAGGGRMLVAPRTGDVVRYQQITRPPDGIRRVA